MMLRLLLLPIISRQSGPFHLRQVSLSISSDTNVHSLLAVPKARLIGKSEKQKEGLKARKIVLRKRKTKY